MLGLVLSGRLRRQPTAAWQQDLHRWLGAISAVFLAAHLAGLALDPTVAFGPAALTVPMAAAWRPGAVTWGLVAAYSLIAVELSSPVMRPPSPAALALDSLPELRRVDQWHRARTARGNRRHGSTRRRDRRRRRHLRSYGVAARGSASAASASCKSAGSGDANAITAPVTGCVNSNSAAWRKGRATRMSARP